MVDGGKGQLSAALNALIDLNCPPIPLLGLAKRNEEIFLPGRSEPVLLSRHSPALKLLQALRDEAHRFAITYHRNLRQREIEKSLLDDIPGIGNVRKIALLKAFGSVANLRKAEPETICRKVPGLGLDLAQQVSAALARKNRSSAARNDKKTAGSSTPGGDESQNPRSDQ